MEKEANQLYRRPQMTGQARDEEEEEELKVIFRYQKRYEGVRCNVICVTRVWVGVQLPEKSVT